MKLRASKIPSLRRTILVAWLAGLSSAPLAHAQAASLSSETAPAATIPPGHIHTSLGALSFTAQGCVTSEAGLKSGGTAYGDVSSTEYGFQLAQKLSVAPRSEFEASLNYRHTAFDRSGNTSAGSTETPVPSGLQSITLGLSGRQQIADSWTAIVGSETGYHGTCGSVFTSKGLGVGVFALASRRFGPSLSLTGGIAYSSLASGFAEFLPVIGVEWQASPKWSVGLGFPKTGVTYHFSDKLRFSLVGEGMAGTYYIKKDPQPGARGRVALNDTKLEYYDVRMGLNAEWLLTGRLRATVTAGTVAMREFDYHQRHFKLKSDHHSHYGSAGVVVSF